MQVVAVLALDGVVGFDLAAAVQVFSSVRAPDGHSAVGGRPYEARVCGVRSHVSVSAAGLGSFTLSAPYGLTAASAADTIIVPGFAGWRGRPPADVLEPLRDAAERGARIASICTGAFALAAAGLLDGRRATTHWAAASELARCYPRVRVDANVLFTEDRGPDGRRILTSAGVAAGLDLCLHLVRSDHGAAVAADVARMVVVPPVRSGGPAQFTTHPAPDVGGSSLGPTLRWMLEHLDEPLTLARISRHAAMSTRTLLRRFREQTGTTPAGWLRQQRLLRARQLLETTALPVTAVASRSGFGSDVALRACFARELGVSPQTYRRTFRVPGAA